MTRNDTIRSDAAATTPDQPVELRIALVGLKLLAVLALPAVGIAWLAASGPGALGAAIAVAVIAGMSLLAAASLSYAARFGPSALMGAALGGYALRLLIYLLLMILLRPIDAIHGPSLAISAAVLVLATLAAETRYVLRTPQLHWLNATTGGKGA